MERYDLVIVGGGAVGAQAAIKAAVLNHRALVLDKGPAFSRVAQAGVIANLPGLPEISGLDLLAAMRRHLAAFQERTGKALVTWRDGCEACHAARGEDGFVVRYRDASGADRDAAAPVLVLATGIVDRKPGIEAFHERGHWTLPGDVRRGDVGYCILCEGWSVEGKRVAVLGARAASASIAKDLAQHFRAHVTLLTEGRAPPAEARDAAFAWDDRVVTSLATEGDEVVVRFAQGAPARFDKAFFEEGWYKANNELAVVLGAQTTPGGFVVTDENGEALDRDGRRIRGLFVVGDLRAGRWKQIMVGWGDAETAVITAYAYRLA